MRQSDYVWTYRPVEDVNADVLAWAARHGVTNKTITGSKTAMNSFVWWLSAHLDRDPEQAASEYNHGNHWGLRVDYHPPAAGDSSDFVADTIHASE